MTPFSKTFVRLRREAGFATAYQFFHKNGGINAFQCSFPNYLRIEKGSHLPKPGRLPLLCRLLRLPLNTDELRLLLRDYIETWLGSTDLADWMLAPFSARPLAAASLDPAKQALRKMVRESAMPLSVAQYEAIMSTAGAYWAYRVITTSKEAWEPADLAKLIGINAAQVKKGLEILRRQAIAKRQNDGRYKSALAGSFLLFPDAKMIAPKIMGKVFQYNQDMIKKRGSLVDVRYCGVRADLQSLRGFIPHFREAVRSVNAYSVTDRSDQSGLFFVEGRVYKLFDF